MSHDLSEIGPKARFVIERDKAAMSPSYTREYPLVVDHAQGSEVWDVDGRRYIDFMSGIAVVGVGHRHPKVMSAVKAQVEKFWHICFSDFYQPEPVQLAEKLQAIAPMKERSRVYFGNSGTEAVEAALKLAMYSTGRSKFIGFLGGFHGRSLGSLSFTASKSVQRERFPSALTVFHAPYPDPYRPLLLAGHGHTYGEAVVDYLEEEVFRTALPARDVAAVLVEPILGEGGYVVPAPGFLPRLREMCDRHGILLIADEIQSGVGRTGRWWAIEHEGVEPDIVCFAKGIASGLPLGGIVARDSLMKWGPGAHGSTFGGNPLAIAAALATLNVIEEEELLSRAERTGSYIMDALAELESSSPIVGHVRGRGLMIGVEIVSDRLSKTRAPGLRNRIVQKCFDLGLLVLPCGPNTVRLIPALNIPAPQLEKGLDLFVQALTVVAEEHKHSSEIEAIPT